MLNDNNHQLLNNIDKIHTTPMGLIRIRLNLNLGSDDVLLLCKMMVTNNDLIIKKGKNYYVYYHDNILTINASSYTIITAHKIKTNKDR